jgi:hypothetical protein
MPVRCLLAKFAVDKLWRSACRAVGCTVDAEGADEVFRQPKPPRPGAPGAKIACGLLKRLTEIPVNDKIPDATNEVSARRRLLRGALSVPTVMTLSSGSALAASSALVCATKLPPGVAVGAKDNFYRVQIYTATNSTGSDPKTRSLVNGVEVTSATPAGASAAFYVDGRTWINLATGLDETAWVRSIESAVTPTELPGQFVALRFTNRNAETTAAPDFVVSGLSETADPRSGTGKVMSMSCWSSFTPSAAI